MFAQWWINSQPLSAKDSENLTVPLPGLSGDELTAYVVQYKAESQQEALEMALSHKETCEQLLQEARDAYSLVLAERLRAAILRSAVAVL